MGCRLMSALQPSGCLLFTQNGVLSLPILLFESKRSRKVRDQVIKEAVAYRNAFGCHKLRSIAHHAVDLWDSWPPSWHKFFSSPNSSVSIKQTFSRLMFSSSAIILTVNLRGIEQVLLPMLCCNLSVLLMVVRCAAHLQQRFCLHKTFCASERLVVLSFYHLQMPAEVFHVS